MACSFVDFPELLFFEGLYIARQVLDKRLFPSSHLVASLVQVSVHDLTLCVWQPNSYVHSV